MRKTFSKHIGYPVFYKQKHYRNRLSLDWFSLLEEMRERERWSLERLQAYQFERLKQLLIHAGRNVPYYSDLFQSCGFQPEKFQDFQELEAIPLLTKDIIREQGERMLSSDAKSRGIYRNGTGGSTGSPLAFYQDQNYRDYQLVSSWMSDMAAGWQMGDGIARLWGARQDVKMNTGTLFKKIENWLLHEFWFNTFNLSEEAMWHYHGVMDLHKPDILIGYAPSLYLFAKFLESNKLQPNYPAKAIISSAEVLSPDMRKLIEQIYKVKAFDRYGSRDGGLIAYECEQHRGLHVNMQTIYLESLVQAGDDQPGRSIITQLENYAMPFIRYDIGDMLVMSDQPCTCGRGAPLIKKIMGRSEDLITLSSGKLLVGYFITHMFLGAEGIKSFQFIQESLSDFTLYIVKGKAFNVAELDSIRKDILNTLGLDRRLSTVFVEEIPPTASGKHRSVISKVPVKFG